MPGLDATAAHHSAAKQHSDTHHTQHPFEQVGIVYVDGEGPRRSVVLWRCQTTPGHIEDAEH
jgi:hypothetical protein